MNIILLNPPPNDRSWYRVEHLGLAYLAATLRQTGHQVKILDAFLENLDVDKTIKVILSLENKIDILGITATEPQTLFSGAEIVNQLRQNGLSAHVTAGGYLPTFWSEEVLIKFPEIDSVVLGEGEVTLKELSEAIEKELELKNVPGLALRDEKGRVFYSPRRSLMADLDTLPFPARDYLEITYEKYHHAVISSSRGCYHKCSFCQIAQFYRLSTGSPYRSRSAKSIADEIEMLVKEYDVRSIFFVDDEFITESSKRIKIIEELIQEIEKRQLKFKFSMQYRADTGACEELLKKLKSVGLSTVFIGVESGVDSVLERFDKGINRENIRKALMLVDKLELNLIAGYMIYHPDTTFDELKKSIKYLLSHEAPILQDLHGMMVLKGTIEETHLQEKGLANERDFKVSYKIQDKKVLAFADLLRHYFPIYRDVVLDIYELLFLLVSLPDEIANEKKKIDHKLKDLHGLLMSKAIEDIENGTLNEKELLNELDEKFQLLRGQTRQMLLRGRAFAHTRKSAMRE
ncbi:MAG: B12-binding domain-containing radical SAM protein [Bacteroidetes bacterium]|jgi:anaerobic magnesium-protoporphyrin IX monomethyl ester cyclase|nr:B12-binding domain-containing radical SAM protein [Bacteroidota bacterium]